MTYHYAARGEPSRDHRQDAQKLAEDRTCSSEDMIADRQTHRHTHTHAHARTRALITILGSPIRGGVMNAVVINWNSGAMGGGLR